MRKNIFAFILAALLVGFLAAPVLAVDCDETFAACDTIPDATGGGAGVLNLQFSPNVEFAYAADTAGLGNKYMMGTFNSKGTKTYGADSDYAGLYQTKADTTDGTAEALPTDQSAVWASDTWAEVAK